MNGQEVGFYFSFQHRGEVPHHVTTNKEIVHFRSLLANFGVPIQSCTLLFCNDMGVIHIACNPVFQNRAKHIEIEDHLARQYFPDKKVWLPHVSYVGKVVDFLTRAHSTF